MIDFKKWYNEKGGKSIITTLRYNSVMLEELLTRTSFMHTDASVSERVYVLVHEISIQHKCPYCNKNLAFHKLNRGYHGTCQSKECVKKHRSVVNKESSKKIDWDESLKKQSDTMMRRFGKRHNLCNGTESREKYYDTMEKLYGHRSPLQIPEIKRKQEETTLNRYGTLDMYHCENTRNTILKKYNVDIYKVNIMSSSHIFNKWKATIMKMYGVDNPMKNRKVFEKNQRNAFKAKKVHDLICRGTYEMDFVEKYFDILKIENGKTIKFNYNKKDKIYFSDFYVPQHNLIVEIKSKYYFDKYKQLNLAKRDACISKGFNFIFIIDKDYTEFNKLLNL